MSDVGGNSSRVCGSPLQHPEIAESAKPSDGHKHKQLASIRLFLLHVLTSRADLPYVAQDERWEFTSRFEVVLWLDHADRSAPGLIDGTGYKGESFEIDDIVVVQVESTQHRIGKAHLVRWSQMFRDMFTLPQGPDTEGSSESNPIVLSGCRNADFEAFLDLIVTPRSLARNITQSQWEAILRLATIWDMPQVSTPFVQRSHSSQGPCHIHQLRSMAIISLSHSNLSAYCKIRLGKTYKVASWLMEGYTNLGRGTYDNLDDLAAQLDWETAARIAHVAYLTSERAKEVPFTIPSSSVNCPGCDEAYTHSNSPWMSESLRVDPLATGKQMYVHRSELESVLALHWIPGKEGERAEWDCLHRRRFSNVLIGSICTRAIFAIDMGRLALASRSLNLVISYDGRRCLIPAALFLPRTPIMPHSSPDEDARMDDVGGLYLKVGDEILPILSSERIDRWAPLVKEIRDLPGDGSVGASEQTPIFLPGCTMDDFITLKLIVEGPVFRELHPSHWKTLLKLGNMWGSENLTKLAIQRMEDQMSDMIERLAFGIECGVARWVISGACALSQAGSKLDLKLMASRLGWKIAARVAEAARCTSELSKYKPIVVPMTTLKCSHNSCNNRLVYSISPRALFGERARSCDAPSTKIVHWKPRVKVTDMGYGYRPQMLEWECGQCKEDADFIWHRLHKTQSPEKDVPLEFILRDLIPDFKVDNTEIVRRIFAEELKDAH
ncbi:hypothetical protein NMY22_g9004 [Coprinellus aureogranulatus]|nr:hypothetical protein NMY22_g9004 [Coprinellus aureogranulatus]